MKIVLLVDDDAFTRNVFAQTLNRRGFEVRHAVSRVEGFAVIKRGAVDLIVVDGLLPDCDPVAFVEELRDQGNMCPIVFLSSVFRDERDSYAHLTEELGVALVLHKPISPVEFCAQIENIFDHSSEAKWLPNLADYDVILEAESSRLAYRDTLRTMLEEFEKVLENLRDQGGPPLEALEFLALVRSSASRYGFFQISRATGRIEAVLSRLEDPVLPAGRHLWAEAFDSLDEAIVASRTPTGESVDDSPSRATSSVLVIDDDPTFLEEVEAFGREHFVRVLTARNTVEVMDRVRDPTLDALLVDVDLGEGFDTFEFVRRLRERSFANRLSLGFIAAHGSVPDRVVAAHLGASVFVEKPIDSTQFADIVHRLTSGRSRERPVVVVVDEDDGFVNETSDILSQAGMHPVHLENSQEVVERLDSLSPNGLIVNVSMPGIGGFDLCRMIRAMPRWHDLPILLVGERMDAETRIAAFRSGADDYLLKPPIREELLARLEVRIERLRLLREQASVDMLTGLLTRRPFLQLVNARLSEVRRQSRSLTLGLLDLDNFKHVNDTYGHVAGDRVLAALGRLLANRFRLEDVRARWGGEEFMVALVGEDGNTAARILQRTLDEFSRMVFVGDEGQKFSVAFSAGVSVFPEDGDEFRELLEVADRRLYRAKASGRKRIVASNFDGH